jgi:hypothetical protein
VTIGIGTLLPDVTITTDYGTFLRGLGLPEAQIEASLAALEAVPIPVSFVLQGPVAGLTINALAALGEELGWRGLLLRELSPLGFWRVSLLAGLVWGIWHAPLIVQGHNFPDAPYVGIVMMTAWTITVTPVFTYIAVRARPDSLTRVVQRSCVPLAGVSHRGGRTVGRPGQRRWHRCGTGRDGRLCPPRPVRGGDTTDDGVHLPM